MAPQWLIQPSLASLVGAFLVLWIMAMMFNPDGRDYRGWWRSCMECGGRMRHRKGCSRG